MNYSSSIVCYPITRRIFSIEHIIVKVEHRYNQKSSYCPNPVDYNYSKAAPSKMSVAQWVEKRFNKCFPQLQATVLTPINTLEKGSYDGMYILEKFFNNYCTLTKGYDPFRNRISDYARSHEYFLQGTRSHHQEVSKNRDGFFENKILPIEWRKVIDCEYIKTAGGVQLSQVKQKWMPRSCAYFANLGVKLVFLIDENNPDRTNQAVAQIQKQLNEHGILLKDHEIANAYRATVNEYRATWMIVKAYLPKVVLTYSQASELEKYFITLAKKYGGKSSFFYWDIDRFLDEPFNAKNVGTDAEDLKQILGESH